MIVFMQREQSELEAVADRRSAAVLVKHPLRVDILRAAHAPTSASRIASELGLPRQKVNYHVRELARAGLLRRAGRRKRGNMYEQRYVATARQYVLSPEVLGELAADPEQVTDVWSAAYLMALGGRMGSELARVTRDAADKGQRLATLSMQVEVGFANAKQRAAFAAALSQAVTDIVGKHSVPAEGAASGAYRLVLGCYPLPQKERDTP